MENYFNRHPDQIFRLGAHDHSLLQCSLNWSFCLSWVHSAEWILSLKRTPQRFNLEMWESMNGMNVNFMYLFLLKIERYWWEGFEPDISECCTDDVWKLCDSGTALGWNSQRKGRQFQLIWEPCLCSAHWLFSKLSFLVSGFERSSF